MHITWHGNYCVKIQSKEVTVVLDPYPTSVGLPPFRTKAEVVALSSPHNPEMSYTGGISGEPLIIKSPGEYSVRGMTLHALGWHRDDNTESSIQRWQIEDLTILHLGALNRPLHDSELQELEVTGIDVLLLPVGGGSAFSLKEALATITTLEPRVVIPINYALPHLKEKLAGVEQFAKEMGVNTKAAEKKIILKASSLPADEQQTILLSPAFLK
jgi:L-ascorbate metabolism protein UlaG (beta-lactamase superfamily)